MLSFKNRVWLAFIILCMGCEKMDFASQELYDLEALTYSYDAESVTSAEVLQRAWEMANVVWTPVNPVPQRFETYYEPGQTVTGIPYSSVKEINTYLFQDVSYHTFMTAVHNPKSVLYTENISQSPYHGLNCAPFYGGVCSSTVMYALGVSIPYYANQIIDLPFMHKLERQVVDSLKVCDVIWKPGHVQMVFDVEHRADTLYKISMFESLGKSAHISHYTAKGFKQMWTAYDYVAYRRDNIIYTPEPKSFVGFSPIDYNDDLCPSKGDKAVYRTDDTILINIFNTNYEKIVLRKGDRIVHSDTFKGDAYQFNDLEPGIYFCYLQTGDSKSGMVSFEIIRADVSVKTVYNGILQVRFNSNAIADYAAVCNNSGVSEYYPISEADRLKGWIFVPSHSSVGYYCKVVFKGEYGTVINKPVGIR